MAAPASGTRRGAAGSGRPPTGGRSARPSGSSPRGTVHGRPGRQDRRRLRVAKPGRIRILGPVLACLPAVGLAVAAIAVWVGWSCTSVGCVKPSLLTYGLLLLAAPTALLTGLPWILEPLSVGGALVSSAVLWLVLGRWAAGRVTADVDATWRDFWAEFVVMAVGVWLGIAGGFAVITLWMSV